MIEKRYNIDLGDGDSLQFKEEKIYSIINLLEECKMDDKKLLPFIDNFMESSYTRNGKQYDWRKRGFKVDQIWKIMKDYLFGGMISDKKGSVNYAPISANFDFLANRYGTTPIHIIRDMTYSQFTECIEGAIWNINEGSEEGRRKNNEKRRAEMTPEEKENQKKQEKKLDSVAQNYLQKMKNANGN